MRKISCIFQICLICIMTLGLMSCNDDSDEGLIDGDLEQTDGDAEQSDGDTDGDSEQADGDTDSDLVEDSEEVELTPCAMADSGALTQDPDELAEWKERCISLRDPEYNELECEGPCRSCYPVTAGFSSLEEYWSGGTPVGWAVFCEETRSEGGDAETVSTPGPGFGVVLGSNTNQRPTGWHGLGVYMYKLKECEQEGKLSWEQDTIDIVIDRTASDEVCEDISDYHTCLSTHNPPQHCMAVFSWPIVWDGDTCWVNDDRIEPTCDDVKDVEFLACRTVTEPHSNAANCSKRYTGPIRNTESGDCVGLDDCEEAIPQGWEKAACADCTP